MGDTKTLTDDRIHAARQSLQQRVEALEDRVTATVDRATATVDRATTEIRGTVEDATQSVRSLFGSTSENMRGAVDIKRRVQDKPWQGLLLAVGVGLATRWIARHKPAGVRDGVVTETPHPMEDLFAIVRRELVDIGETAVATVSKKLKHNIASLTQGDASAETPSVSPRREMPANVYYPSNNVH
ncbi:hypothetical protein BH11PLA2_BH11PLA2_45020 [soil metagenome]